MKIKWVNTGECLGHYKGSKVSQLCKENIMKGFSTTAVTWTKRIAKYLLQKAGRCPEYLQLWVFAPFIVFKLRIKWVITGEFETILIHWCVCLKVAHQWINHFPQSPTCHHMRRGGCLDVTTTEFHTHALFIFLFWDSLDKLPELGLNFPFSPIFLDSGDYRCTQSHLALVQAFKRIINA